MKVLILLCVVLVVPEALAQFTATGQQAIVDAHNTLRSSIAKGTYVAKGTQLKSGANIRKIKWDTTYATYAQNFANTCPTAASRGSGYPENVLAFWAPKNTSELDSFGTKACASWEQEVQGWTSNIFDISNVYTGGHATQMAWANTFAVGCGVKNCGLDALSNNKMVKIFVICLYNPAGNWVYQPIYQQGATCSACQSGTVCENATGLCV